MTYGDKAYKESIRTILKARFGITITARTRDLLTGAELAKIQEVVEAAYRNRSGLTDQELAESQERE